MDDLEKEDAFRVYEEFGFKNKKLVWDYIGGKLGDMVSLYEREKREIPEEVALKNMLDEEKGKIRWLRKGLKEGFKKGPKWENVEGVLKRFLNQEKVSSDTLPGEELLFLIKENILFYNPLEGTVRPQSRLIWRAIKEVL